MTTFSKFFGAAAALALLPMAISCSSDDFGESGGNTVAEEGDYYIRVAISGVPTSGTRAGTEAEFDSGTEAENQIKDIYFIFYDENGGVVGEMSHLEYTDLTPVTVTLEDDSPIPSTQLTYEATVNVSLAKGQSLPTQVMCYINPITTENFKEPLNMLTSIKRDTYGPEGYYCMSNSVYYPEENTGKLPQVAAPIKDGQLIKGTHKDEDNVEEKNKVKIYVERYAAKVALDLTPLNDEGNVTDYTPAQPQDDKANTFSLTFNEVKWTVNAVDKQTFSVKSFDKLENFGTPASTQYTYGELNTVLAPDNTTWAWNSPSNFRSYWGCSTSYYSTAYPSVSSDYNKENPEYADYLLDYYSYNQITAADSKIGTTTKGQDGKYATTSRYSKETTAGTYGLQNAENPAASVASVVLVGYYTVNKNGVPLDEQPENFYTYLQTTENNETKPRIYFGTNDEGKCDVGGGASIMTAMLDNSTIVYLRKDSGKKDSDGNTIYDYESLEGSMLSQDIKLAFDVVRPNDNVLNGQKLPSNKVTLQLTTVDAANNANIVIATSKGYLTVVNDPTEEQPLEEGCIGLTEANRFIASSAQYADRYNGGKAYFNIPIQHYGWYRAGNENADTDFSNLNWSKVRVGDFGLVRNHSYNVKVNSISGLGTAISNPNDPIIPPAETTEYHMHCVINILNWAVLPIQGVDL